LNTLQGAALRELVLRALAATTSQCVPTGNSSWRFRAADPAPHLITARIEDDWLVLESDHDVTIDSHGGFIGWLEKNGSIPSLAKFVIDAGNRIRLRAEVPIVEGADLPARIAETCAGLALQSCSPEPRAASVSSRSSRPEDPDLKQLCAEAGWTCVDRSGGRLVVDLQIPECFYPASVHPVEGGVAVQCELAALESVTEECGQAIAGLLLSVSSVVRPVRATLQQEQGSPERAAQLEVRFGGWPSPSEISTALESLSVACSLCGEEVKMLQTPALAGRYLTLRGWTEVLARAAA